jgi:hypothetical protein
VKSFDESGQVLQLHVSDLGSILSSNVDELDLIPIIRSSGVEHDRITAHK